MSVLGVIPARYGSNRLPAKPLLDLAGKPMVQHVYERSRKAKLLDHIVVATDHDAIAGAVRAFGGEVVMTPADVRSGSDRVAYVAKQMPGVDIVVNLQGDEPLIAPGMIDEAVRLLVDDADTNVATVVKAIESADELLNPNIVKAVLDQDGYAIYFSRAPIPYLRDGVERERWHSQHRYYKHLGLYVFRRGFLLEFASWPESVLERTEKLEQLRIIEHGYRIKTTVTAHDSVPVDTPADVDRVLRLMKQTHVNIP